MHDWFHLIPVKGLESIQQGVEGIEFTQFDTTTTTITITLIGCIAVAVRERWQYGSSRSSCCCCCRCGTVAIIGNQCKGLLLDLG